MVEIFRQKNRNQLLSGSNPNGHTCSKGQSPAASRLWDEHIRQIVIILIYSLLIIIFCNFES